MSEFAIRPGQSSDSILLRHNVCIYRKILMMTYLKLFSHLTTSFSGNTQQASKSHTQNPHQFLCEKNPSHERSLLDIVTHKNHGEQRVSQRIFSAQVCPIDEAQIRIRQRLRDMGRTGARPLDRSAGRRTGIQQVRRTTQSNISQRDIHDKDFPEYYRGSFGKGNTPKADIY